MLHRWGWSELSLVLACSLIGCATTTPYVGIGPHPQVSRGHAVPPVDALGNVFGVFSKLLLWNWKMSNHAISERTEDKLVDYMGHAGTNTEGTLFSLNEYAPLRSLKRLTTNQKVAWPYRLLLGLPVTLVLDVAIPGRLFAGLIGGDSYNPFTDTVAIYSDLPPVALHEAGHAHDFNSRHLKGTYALIRLIPLLDLYQEYEASDAALQYLIDTGDREEEFSAYRLLYPAFGTYAGSYVFPPIGTLGGAIIGHAVGRNKVRQQRQLYESQEAAGNPGTHDFSRPSP